jgi:hypothetical protein
MKKETPITFHSDRDNEKVRGWGGSRDKSLREIKCLPLGDFCRPKFSERNKINKQNCESSVSEGSAGIYFHMPLS